VKLLTANKGGFFKSQYENSLRLKVSLLVVETLFTVVSLRYLDLRDWNYHLVILFLLFLLSYRLEKIMFDSLTRTAIFSCLHLLPAFATYLVFGFPEALLLNYIAYLVNLFIFRSERKSAESEHGLKSSESVFVFLVFYHFLSFPAKALGKANELAAIYLALILVIAVYLHLAMEGYFAALRKKMKPSFYFKQIIILGYPNYLLLFAIMLFLILFVGKKTSSSWLPFYLYATWLLAAGFNLVSKSYLLNLREKQAVTFEYLASLTAKTEKDERKRRLMIEYLKKIASEASLSAMQYDQVVAAGLIHDVGKAGLDVYSVDAIIEDIRAYKGDPLHAERAAECAAGISGLEPVVDILRYHHRYQDREVYSRLKRGLRYQASLLNVAELMAELLVEAEEPIYDERHAYKDLKKDSGWDFDPRALRDLRKVLLREGHHRI
jgi:hypothetical protein